MQKLVFINGSGNEIDLTSGSFGITNWAGLSNVPLNIQTQQVPFEDGGVYLDALMNQRDISVTVAIYDGNNLELRYQKKRELISALNPKLGEGTLIYTNDYLSKQIKAVPQVPLFQNKNSNDAGTLKSTVAFSCPSPYWEDVEETVIEINNNDIVEIENNGDIPAQITGIINAKGKNVTLKNSTNEKKISVINNESYDIYFDTNLGKKKVEKQNHIMDYLAGGTFNSIIPIDDKLFVVGSQFIIIDINNQIKTVQITPDKNIYDVAYSKELGMYAICGGQISSANSAYIYTSKDLKNWTKATLPTLSYTQSDLLSTISYEDGKFKAHNRYLGSQCITSQDGLNWELETTTIIKDNAKIYVEDSELYVRVDGYNIQTSTDNVNWTTVYTLSFPIEIGLNSLCYLGGTFYFCGGYGLLISSNDLVNFDIINVIPTNVIQDIIKYNNKLYAIGQGGGIMFISETGLSWIYKYNTILNTEAYQIRCGNGVILISATNSKIYRSVDEGDNWQSFNLSPAEYIIPLEFFEDEESFYASDLFKIFKSSNGLDWTSYGEVFVEIEEYPEPIAVDNMARIVKFKNEYYILGKLNYDYESLCIIKTSDFINYSIVYIDTSISNFNPYTVNAYTDENYILFTVENKLLKSKNGTNWNKVDLSSYFNHYITSIKMLNNEYWFTGIDVTLRTIDFINYTQVQNICIGASIYTAIEFKDELIFGGSTNYAIFSKYAISGNTNIINELTQDSNMNLNLDVGINKILLTIEEGKANATLKFRQKYIGV